MDESLQICLQNQLIFSLQPERIDSSGNWLFWSEKPAASFCEQISAFGQLVPVLVAWEEEKWLLVSGYQRVKACQEIKRPVLALQVSADNWSKGIIYMQTNNNKPIEEKKALAALRYFQHIARDESWLQQALYYLQLPLKGRWAQSLSNWMQLPTSWDRHLYAERIDLACASLLSCFSAQELALLDPFFADLSWSRNKARNFLTWLWESKRRKGQDIHIWLPQTNIQKMLQLELSPKDKLARILEESRAERFPQLVKLEEKAALLTKDLARGSKWDIQPDPSFEQNTAYLKLSVNNRQELNMAIQELKEIALAAKWEEFWSLTRDLGPEESK